MKLTTHPLIVAILRARVLCPLLVMLLIFQGTSSYGQYFYENWDDGHVFHWTVQGGSAQAVSNKYSQTGNYSFRSYVAAKQSNNPRHEIVFKGTNIPNEFELYQDYTVQFAMYIPGDFKPDYDYQDEFMQMLGRKDANETYSKPHINMYLKGYDIYVAARWVRRNPASDSDITTKLFEKAGKVERGKWNFFTIEFKMDPRSTGNGYVRVYKRTGSWPTNSHKIADYKGPTGSFDNRGPYVKFGIYKWWWRNSSAVTAAKNKGIYYRELFYDNIKIQKGLIINGPEENGSSVDYGSYSGSSLFYAGYDFTVKLSEKKFLLTAGWSPDFKIKSLRWKKISGPSSSHRYVGYQYEVTSIKLGKYVFEAEGVDDRGRKVTDRVAVTVTDKATTTSNSGSGGSSGSGTSSSTFNGIVDAGDNFSIGVSDKQFLLTPRFGQGIKPEKLRWTKISGPSASTAYVGYPYRVSNIKVGTYVFEVRIEYSGGKVATDRITVTVTDGTTATTANSNTGSTSSGTSTTSTVSAGNDFSIAVSKGNFLLKPQFGSGIKPERLQWRKISGPAASMAYEGYSYRVNNIKVGTYVFEVWIQYSGGKTATDRINVSVTQNQTTSSSSSNNTSSGSGVNAGPDQSVSVTKGSFVVTPTFDRTKIDVAGLRWFKVSGPSFSGRYLGYAYEVSSIKVGTYVFEVRLTASNGTVYSDRVKINVVSGSTINTSLDEFGDLIAEEDIQYGVVRNYISTGQPLELIKSRNVASEVQMITVTGQPVQVGYQNGLLETERLSPGLYIYNLLDGEGQLIQKGRIIKQ